MNETSSAGGRTHHEVGDARQSEAEREQRAKIIAAEDESLAAAALGEASDMMMTHPSRCSYATCRASSSSPADATDWPLELASAFGAAMSSTRHRT